MRALPLLLALCFSLACGGPTPEKDPQDKLKVLVTETRAYDERYGQMKVEVTDGSKRFCYSAGGIGSAAQRISSFQEVIRQDKYLFVPANCGGGNASKCRGYQAFSTEPTLKWLGHITGRWDGDRVVLYDGGNFYDTGDMLESNYLMSHAESPRYTMVYSEKDGFQFESAKTWAINADAYEGAPTNAAGLLYRAGLAKLCGRAKELAELDAIAVKFFSGNDHRRFEKSMDQVKTKDVKPNPFIPVQACTDAEKS